MYTVDLSQFFPLAWLIHFVRAFVAFNICHSILKDKYNNFVTFASIIIPCMLYSFLTLTFITNMFMEQNELLVMFIYYVMIFIILIFVSEGNLFSKLFASSFSLIVYLITTIGYNAIKILIGGPNLVTGLSYETSLVDYMVDVLFVFSFSFIFSAFFKFMKNRKQETFMHKSKFTFFFLFPITHIFTSMIIFIPIRLISEEDMSVYYTEYKYAEAAISIFFLLCIIIDLSIIFIVDHIEKIEEQNIQNEKELMKNRLDYQQMFILKEEKQKFRKIKHDYANILATAKGFIEIGKPEKALSILQSTNDDLTSLYGFSLCSNETVNTILYIKHQQAENSNIQIVSNISESYAVNVDDYDLCRVLNNIIDNSLNAVSRLSTERICKINIEIDEDKIIILSSNKFLLDKHNKNHKSKEHGNGIGIVKEIVSKYGGKYAARQENDVWYTETFLSNKKLANSTPPPNFGLTKAF